MFRSLIRGLVHRVRERLADVFTKPPPEGRSNRSSRRGSEETRAETGGPVVAPSRKFKVRTTPVRFRVLLQHLDDAIRQGFDSNDLERVSERAFLLRPGRHARFRFQVTTGGELSELQVELVKFGDAELTAEFRCSDSIVANLTEALKSSEEAGG
jgi:hypothetical protein